MEAGLPQSSLMALFEAIQAQSAEALTQVPGMTEAIQLALSTAMESAYADAFAYVYYAAMAVGGVAVIAALCMKDYDPYLTGHIPKQVGKRNYTPNLEPDAAEPVAREDTKEQQVTEEQQEFSRA